MTEAIGPQLFVSMFLVIFVILASLIFRKGDAQTRIESDKEPIDRQELDKLKEENSRIIESCKKELNEKENQRLSLLEKLDNQKKDFEARIKQLEQTANISGKQELLNEIKKPIEALEGYSELFESGKIGELNDELKYTAGLIVKKVKQLKDLLSKETEQNTGKESEEVKQETEN